MSSTNKSITVEDGTEELDALAKFNELYGDLDDSDSGAGDPPQSNENDPCPELEDDTDPYSYNPYDITQLPQTEGEVKSCLLYTSPSPRD